MRDYFLVVIQQHNLVIFYGIRVFDIGLKCAL